VLEFNDGAAGHRGADAAAYFLQCALRRAVGLSRQAARVTVDLVGLVIGDV
jgi:hypothetical protein